MYYEVTIGIPLYNAEQFIDRTMKSVLSQTFDSIELLIMDDCSTDKSVQKIQEIKQEHPRGGDIHIIHQPKNMGVSAARNRIIDEALGKYLYFMDSDDMIAPNCISLLYGSIKKNNAEIAFGSYEKREVGDDSKAIEQYCYPNKVLDNGELGTFAFRKYGGIQASVWNYLIDLSFLRKTGHKFIDSNYWEDMVFTYILSTLINRAVMHSDITYYYMCRENSLSQYQSRNEISQSEILRNVNTVEHLKRHTTNILDKNYLGNWCYNVVMTDMYIIFNVIKNKKKIHPELTSKQIQSFIKHPLKFSQIARLSCSRNRNLFLYILSKLPANISLYLIKIIGKKKGLI